MIELQPTIKINKWPYQKKSAVALCFDDWSPGQYDIAIPILNKIGFPSTFFVNQANFAMRPSDDHWWTLQQAKFQGHDIGNLGLNARPLTALNDEERFEETVYAKEIIEDNILDQDVSIFAYPQGRYNQNIIEEIKSHYSSARTYTDYEDIHFDYDFAENTNDYYALQALVINDSISPTQYRNLLFSNITKNGLFTQVFTGIYNADKSNDKNLYDSIHENAFNKYLSIISEYSKDLWITPLNNAINYHKLANTTTIKQTKSDRNTITVNFQTKLFSPQNTKLSLSMKINPNHHYQIRQENNDIHLNICSKTDMLNIENINPHQAMTIYMK